MDRIIVTLVCVTLLAISYVNFGRVVDGMPALDPSARIEGVYGEWRVPVGPALYNRADYLFELGYGFAHGDTLISGATEGRGELADLSTSRFRSGRAIELLNESLSLAPGNVLAWDTLAWSNALLGNFDAALDAALVSWALAPNNLLLSYSRLPLVDLIVENGNALSDPSEVVIFAISRDLAVLSEFDPDTYASALQNSAFLRALPGDNASEKEPF